MTRIIPFLETFWGLADERPEVRVKAAQCLLMHCFQFQSKLNTNKNDEQNSTAMDVEGEEKTAGVAIVDCAYALRRLLDGLNSGRASARQGFASCLSSFLRLAFSKDVFSQIRAEMESSSKDKDIEDCEFLRVDLQERTNSKADPKKSKQRKKGSEERDGAFGKLFGILAISRSGILSTASTEIVNNYFNDVVSLYRWRKWMREPCAHAIIEMLESLLFSDEGKVVAKKVAQQLIISKFLISDEESKNTDLSPEALGVAIFIERQFNLFTFETDARLILESDSDTKEKILKAMANTTSATSMSVENSNVQGTQRRHLLWKQIRLMYSSCEEKEQSKILSFIFHAFLQEKILNSNLTSERNTLALALVMDYAIPEEGIIPSSEMISDFILTPQIIQKLFLNTISASKGHILRQMATYVLSNIVKSCIKHSAENPSMLAFGLIKAFIAAEPNFDSRTKSSSISSLLTTLDTEKFSELMGFLEQQILNHAAESMDSSDSLPITEGFLNLFSNLPKILVQNKSSEQQSINIDDVRRRVLGFLIAGAFFDCKNTKSIARKSKRKKAEKSDSTNEFAVTAARMIQSSLSGSLSGQNHISYPVRRMLSCKFFTSLSDYVSSVPNSRKLPEGKDNGDDTKSVKTMSKSEYAFQTLTFILEQTDKLEENKAIPYKRNSENGMDEDEEEETLTMVEAKKEMSKLQSLAQETLANEKESTNGKGRAIIGCTTLLMTLYVQLLNCGANEAEESGIQDEIEQEEEEEIESTEELIKDLIHASNSILDILDGKTGSSKQGDEDDEDENDNPLSSLAEICVATLSLFDNTGYSSRSTKILREATKMAWTGCLIAAASTEINMKVSTQIADFILESVCGDDATSSSNENAEDEDMEDAESINEDEINDEDAFNTALETGLDVDDSEEKSKDSDVIGGEEDSHSEEEEEDIELDPTQLQNLLLEDNDLDSNGEEFQLEHHEGADAALAQLIKLKQDTRKKAVEEKERVEITHRLRCLSLLESLFSSHGSNSDSSVFENDSVIVMMLLPILKTRRKLEKAISYEKNTKRNGASSEKKNLLEKLSQIFRSKVCKTKSMSQVEHAMIDVTLLGTFEEAKKSLSSGHCSCCSSALLLLINFVDGIDKRCELVKKVYEDAVEEWSTRRSTKLHGVLFDDIITKFPEISRAALVPSVAKAGLKGRSAFLKAEAFRYLSTLFGVSTKDQQGDNSPVNEKANVSLRKHAPEAISAINEAIQNEEFTKAKRVRDLLKASEKITHFCIDHSCTIDEQREFNASLISLSSNLKTLSEKTQSSNVKVGCEKLIEVISNFSEKVKVEVETTETQVKSPKSSKKKKKKGKGKKGKK